MTDKNTNQFDEMQFYDEDITGVTEAYIRNNNAEKHTPGEFAELTLNITREEDGRKETSDAFLLSRNDAKYLLKANNINLNAWMVLMMRSRDKRTGEIGDILPEDLLQEVEEAFKKEKVALSRLKKIVKRTEGQKYWYYRTASLLVPKEDEEGHQDVQATVVILLNDKVVHNSFPYDGIGEQIIFASNPIERAKLAGIPEGYKYLPYCEYNALEDLRSTIEALTRKEPIQAGQLQDKLNLQILPNSPLIDAISQTGRRALLKKQTGGQRLTGEQLSTAVSSKGVSIIGLTGKEELLLNPDAHRVLTIFISMSQADGYKNDTYSIPVTELAKRMGLKDPKESTKKIAQALDELYSFSLEWYGPDNYFFKSRYASSAGILRRKGRGGSLAVLTWGTDFKTHLKSDRTRKYQIPDNITEIRDDNAYKIALELFRLYRMNNGKKNEGIVSVMTLLDVCNFIPYEELGKDKGKASQRIIRPFVNALETLVDRGYLKEWTFNYMARDNKGTILSDEDTTKAHRNYKLFSSLAIHYVIDPNFTPDYSKVLDGKQRHRRKKETK